MPRRPKRPSRKVNPPDKKIPRGVDKAIQGELDLVGWHVRTIDRNGPWGWEEINAPTVWNHIFSKMRDFETMTWGEILGKNNHQISISEISPEAQRRLIEINQDDIEDLVSLRVDAKKRIWGIRDRHICKILWWDPKHTVCPAKKRHT